jgi:hypothetical protein
MLRDTTRYSESLICSKPKFSVSKVEKPSRGERDMDLEKIAAIRWASTHNLRYPVTPILGAMPFYDALVMGVNLGLIDENTNWKGA